MVNTWLNAPISYTHSMVLQVNSMVYLPSLQMNVKSANVFKYSFTKCVSDSINPNLVTMQNYALYIIGDYIIYFSLVF